MFTEFFTQLSSLISTPANEPEQKPCSEGEEAFRKRVNTAYKITTVAVSALALIGSFFCPPLILVSAGLALVASQLHYYDKRNNYELSHYFIGAQRKENPQAQQLSINIDNRSEQKVQESTIRSYERLEHKAPTPMMKLYKRPVSTHDALSEMKRPLAKSYRHKTKKSFAHLSLFAKKSRMKGGSHTHAGQVRSVSLRRG